LVPGAAGGSVHVAPAAILMVQIATFVSARAAHERGGGAGTAASIAASCPATTVTSVGLPPASRAVCRGIMWFQSIEKCASTILSAAGRFNQI